MRRAPFSIFLAGITVGLALALLAFHHWGYTDALRPLVGAGLVGCVGALVLEWRAGR